MRKNAFFSRFHQFRFVPLFLKKKLYYEWSPTWHFKTTTLDFMSAWSCQVRVDIQFISWNASGYSQLHGLTGGNLLTFFLTYLLTFCLTFFLTYLLTLFLTFFLAYLLTYLLAFFLTYLLTFFLFISSNILSDILSDISSDIVSNILSGISPDILSGILTYLLTFCLTDLVTVFLTFLMTLFRTFFLVFFLTYLLNIFWHSVISSDTLSDVLSGISPDILSDILSDILFPDCLYWTTFMHEKIALRVSNFGRVAEPWAKMLWRNPCSFCKGFAFVFRSFCMFCMCVSFVFACFACVFLLWVHVLHVCCVCFACFCMCFFCFACFAFNLITIFQMGWDQHLEYKHMIQMLQTWNDISKSIVRYSYWQLRTVTNSYEKANSTYTQLLFAFCQTVFSLIFDCFCNCR